MLNGAATYSAFSDRVPELFMQAATQTMARTYSAARLGISHRRSRRRRKKSPIRAQPGAGIGDASGPRETGAIGFHTVMTMPSRSHARKPIVREGSTTFH